MLNVIWLRDRHQAARKEARVSKVKGRPERAARSTKAGQRDGGMPRVRQVLTVERGKCSSDETAPVPPNSSITSSAVIMPATIVRELRTCQGFATCEKTLCALCGQMELMGEDLAITAQRLIWTRLALGFTEQSDFAKELGLAKNVYNPYEMPESGRRITLGAAIKIRDRFKVSLDWIYCGDPSGLPVELYHKIQEVRKVA